MFKRKSKLDIYFEYNCFKPQFHRFHVVYEFQVLYVLHVVNILHARALMAESTGFQACLFVNGI